MPPLWLLTVVWIVGGILAGAIFVWGFRSLLILRSWASQRVCALLGIASGGIFIVLFVFVPLWVDPKPVRQRPLFLFDFYLAGFMCPVVLAVVRAIIIWVRRTR